MRRPPDTVSLSPALELTYLCIHDHPGTQQDARRMHVFVTVQLLTEYQLSVHNVLVKQYQHLGLFLFHFYPYPYCYCYSLHLHLRSSNSNAALVIIKHFLFTALFFTAKELIPIIRYTPTRRHSNAVLNTRHGLVFNIPFISPSI